MRGSERGDPMSDVDELKELNNQAFKVGMISNGGALTLSLAAYMRLGGAELEISKFPIWCFFFALVVGGLIIIARIFSVVLGAHMKSVEGIDEIEKNFNNISSKIEELRNSYDEILHVLPEASAVEFRQELLGAKRTFEELKQAQTDIQKKISDLWGDSKETEDKIYESAGNLHRNHKLYRDMMGRFAGYLLVSQYLLFLVGATVGIYSL